MRLPCLEPRGQGHLAYLDAYWTERAAELEDLAIDALLAGPNNELDSAPAPDGGAVAGGGVNEAVSEAQRGEARRLVEAAAGARLRGAARMNLLLLAALGMDPASRW